MKPNSRRSLLAAPIAFALVAFAAPVRALDLPGTEPPPADFETEAASTDRTPPRLSHIDGQASFWREGAEEWTQARVNTPLAPGDQLYVDNGSNLELQIGSRDFLRVASNSQLAFDNDERGLPPVPPHRRTGFAGSLRPAPRPGGRTGHAERRLHDRTRRLLPRRSQRRRDALRDATRRAGHPDAG